MLPLLAHLRTEEQGLALERDVENLRMGNRILMEMGKEKGEGNDGGVCGCVVG